MSHRHMLSLILTLSVFLSSCSVVFPVKYNETEYRTLVEIATVVSLGACDKVTTDKLVLQSTFLVHYTKHMTGNKETHKAVILIQEMVNDLYKRVEAQQPISQTFCATKLELIGEAVDSLQQASGGKIK